MRGIASSFLAVSHLLATALLLALACRPGARTGDVDVGAEMVCGLRGHVLNLDGVPEVHTGVVIAAPDLGSRARAVTDEMGRFALPTDCGRLYAFSVENWKRPGPEVRYLMSLLKKFLIDERRTLMENDVRLRAIGRISDLPAGVRDKVADALFPQLITAVDGIPLDQPYYADTVLVGPGQRFTVQFQATAKGTWVFHCHKIGRAHV
mgnify:CR=1 FL=1